MQERKITFFTSFYSTISDLIGQEKAFKCSQILHSQQMESKKQLRHARREFSLIKGGPVSLGLKKQQEMVWSFKLLYSHTWEGCNPMFFS